MATKQNSDLILTDVQQKMQGVNDFYIQMGISAVLALVTHLIPADGTSKKKWKAAMLKIFQAISAAYAGDPNFQPTPPTKS